MKPWRRMTTKNGHGRWFFFFSSIHCKNGVAVRLSLKMCNPTETTVQLQLQGLGYLREQGVVPSCVHWRDRIFVSRHFVRHDFFFVRCRIRSLDEGNQFFSQGQRRLATAGFLLLHLCEGAKEAQKITEECATSKFRWTKTTRGFLINPQDIFRTPSDFYCAFRLCIFLLISARIFSA